MHERQGRWAALANAVDKHIKAKQKGRAATMGRLPKKKTVPKTDLEQMIVLLYGPPKIGKSTWASEAPGALFLATEAGLGQLSVYSITSKDGDCCENWADVTGGVWELLKHSKETPASKDQFKTVVIDTVEELIELAAEYVVDSYNQKAEKQVEHISDIGYGKGYAGLWREVKGVINRLARSRYGLVLIAHSFELEIEDEGGKYNKIVPSMSARIRTQISAMADLILLADTIVENGQEQRVIHTKPSKFHDAGDRTGKLPARLPLAFEAVADALRDEIKSWGVNVYQIACKHPALNTKTDVMDALASVVQVATGNEKATYDLELLRGLDEEIRTRIQEMVESEVGEAVEAHQQALADAEKEKQAEAEQQPEETEPDEMTEPAQEEEKEPEPGPEEEKPSEEKPEKPKGKKGTKKPTKKKPETKPDPEPEPEPEAQEGDDDGKEEVKEDANDTAGHGSTPFD